MTHFWDILELGYPPKWGSGCPFPEVYTVYRLYIRYISLFDDIVNKMSYNVKYPNIQRISVLAKMAKKAKSSKKCYKFQNCNL